MLFRVHTTVEIADEDILSLSAHAVADYLVKRGWKQYPSSNPNYIFLEVPNGDEMFEGGGYMIIR